MKVYVLIGAIYHENDFSVIGVYSTFEKAKAQKAKEEDTKEYEYYVIVEADVDKDE